MGERKSKDIAVIGSGPGGYVAAIRASQLGKSVVLIEKGDLGGTCLNIGCIPSKALLSGAALLHQIKRAHEFGILIGPISLQYDKMKERKDKVVQKMRGGLEGLLKANQVEILKGSAQFESPATLKVLGEHPCFIDAKSIIIATGSIPMDLKAFPCDHDRILNSTSALALTRLPKSIAIVGGGYIGCEFATLFHSLGSKVTILEALPSILTLQGKTVSDFMAKSFTARGIEIRTNVSVEAIENQKTHAHIRLAGGETLEAEYALISVGRKVYTEGLKLEKAGISPKERGVISVNDKMETEVPGIYAIGDVTGQFMLAHVASHQGVVAASNASGREARMHYEAVPAVVFTSPEIATVGFTTVEEAAKHGFQATAGMFPFKALGKAVAAEETEGFAQILADKKTGAILGAVIIGHEATNLIAEMAVAIQNELTLESIIETIHAHPTIAEGWHEAALLAFEMPINFPPVKRRV